MSTACHAFRRHLEALLAGPTGEDQWRALGWHEHLAGCRDCCALLEAEEALELLLASLPVPSLPPRLTRRVLERLRAQPQPVGDGEARLDALLDLDQIDAVPAGLAERVRAGLSLRVRAELEARRERRLDELLEAAGAVDVPPALAARVLAGLRSRPGPREAVSWRPFPGWLRSRALRGLAATLLAALALWLVDRAGSPSPAEPGFTEQRMAQADLPAGLLEVMPALEFMDVIDVDDSGLLAFTGLEDSHLALMELRSPEFDESDWSAPAGGGSNR